MITSQYDDDPFWFSINYAQKQHVESQKKKKKNGQQFQVRLTDKLYKLL